VLSLHPFGGRPILQVLDRSPSLCRIGFATMPNIAIGVRSKLSFSNKIIQQIAGSVHCSLKQEACEVLYQQLGFRGF